MMIKPLLFDGSMQRILQQGDIIAGAEVIPATVVTTNITVTGAQLAVGVILRNPAASATDTLDSATNILAALQGNYGAIQNNTTMRVRWIVTTAQTVTVAATANTGVTVNRGSISASSAKEFLLTVKNGSPPQNYSCVTANGSAVITGLTEFQTRNLSPGMIVTNAVAGLQGAKILSVQPAVGVTMDTNATSDNAAPGVAVSFSPVIQLDGLQQGGV